MKYKNIVILVILLIVLGVMFFGDGKFLPFLTPVVFAHCDTMGGPVILAAKKALETGNVKLILIWVQKKDEAEIKEIFNKTLAVRKLNKDAQKFADNYFFETLVRIHRAGEGVAYTGIKAAEEIEPAIAAADKAIETGAVDNLVKEISSAVTGGIQERFKHTMEKKKHMDESVEAGREFVEAYVTFIHYVEKLHMDASAKGAHHGETEGVKSEGHKH
ncbi:hypothetical protein HY745_11960 [Candidatus Desantisbacteria bacterium]|nr:hypothetical protein [Candidatus Desantisbacteria bacterium]